MEQQKARVLVVDDELELAQLYKERLDFLGYACRMAFSGEMALHLLDQEPAELALVDITMPGMSGLTLFEHIQKRYPDCVVCFVTAMDNLGTAVRQMKSGACDYLVKPVTLKRLKEVVGEALKKRDEQLSKREAYEQKARELLALNRLFQQYLGEHASNEHVHEAPWQANTFPPR